MYPMIMIMMIRLNFLSVFCRIYVVSYDSQLFPHIAAHHILLNAVTSPETVLNGNSVKIKLYKTPSPILHCISNLGDNNGGQGY